MRIAFSLILLFCWVSPQETAGWELGPFVRADAVNPILSPIKESHFYCPLTRKDVTWESDHTFNPGAVVRNGKVYLIYRAEDDSGSSIGRHTSRLGIAESSDGFHFKRKGSPVFYPSMDGQSAYEWPGGCEDPRIVEAENGSFVMTYTQWNREIAVLAVATSRDLMHWTKHGYAFAKACGGEFGRRWSKSGAIVCRLEGDRLIATKVKGKYWMYWGEGVIYAATSDDLIAWEPVLNAKGDPDPIVKTRPWHFDSGLVEPGPPALLTKKGIVFLYNGKNSSTHGDPRISSGAYAAGQLLMDANHPTQYLKRSSEYFFKPEKPFETKGQYEDGTVFIQGLVRFQGRWLLYYGAADSVVGVAFSEE